MFGQRLRHSDSRAVAADAVKPGFPSALLDGDAGAVRCQPLADLRVVAAADRAEQRAMRAVDLGAVDVRFEQRTGGLPQRHERAAPFLIGLAFANQQRAIRVQIMQGR